MVLSRWLTCLWLVFVPLNLIAQDDAATLETQRMAAQRFLQVLIQRPRPGTALDRVYSYHAQTETLDPLIDRLTADASSGGTDAGSKLFLAGLIQLQHHREADAAHSFELAEPLTKDPMVSFYLAKSWLQIGDTDAATKALQRCIDLHPAKSEALPVYTELARIYLRAQEVGNANLVWEQLEHAFAGDVRVGEQIARTFAEEGQPDAALLRYEKLANQSQTADDTKSITYTMRAAELKRTLGRSEEAIADLEALLTKLRPGSWLHGEARRLIEASVLVGGDYSALADYYVIQAALYPDDLDTLNRSGRALLNAGRLVEAETVMLTAIRLAPDDVEVRLALIDVFHAKNIPAEVAKQYETLAKLDAENPDYLVQWGQVVLQDDATPLDQRRKIAAEIWLRLVAARPTDAVTMAQVAALLRRIERTDDAIALYRKAIELAPDQAQFREYLGEYFHFLGRKSEAIVVWQSIADGDRRSADSLIRLADIFTTFKEPDRAIAAFQDAASFDLTFAQRLRFARLLADADRFDEALLQLDGADTIAESAAEKDQIFQQRIGVYQTAKTLNEQISRLQRIATTGEDYRRLALMHQAAGQTKLAFEAIQHAVEIAPQDIAVLSVAGELYSQNARYADAIDMFSKLAQCDRRFRSRYLQSIAELQIRLGNIDDALLTGKELIAASPGSAAAYQQYAALCFRGAADDAGLEALSQAVRLAPRDNDVRNALAAALADRSRTEEAIELYWQSFSAAKDINAQALTVRALTPLCIRNYSLPQLLSRLEQHGRDKSDMRSALLLVAEAHETIGDFASAREVLRPLLLSSPRDVALLDHTVRLAVAMGDSEGALEYQQQLLELADTPENRERWLAMLIDADKIELAVSENDRLGDIDGHRVNELIDRAIQAKKYSVAIRFCEAVLKRDDGRWDIKAKLAYSLVATDQYADFVDAIRVSQEVLALDLADETRPPFMALTSANTLVQGTQSTKASIPRSTYPSEFARRFVNYVQPGRSNPGTGVNLVEIEQYYQARTIAICVLMTIAAKQSNSAGQFNELVNPAEMTTSTNLRKLWDAYVANECRNLFGRPTANLDLIDQAGISQVILTRLALQGGDEGEALLMRTITLRFLNRHRILLIKPTRLLSGNLQVRIVGQPEKKLDSDVITVLKTITEELLTQDNSTRDFVTLARIYDELRLANQDDFANRIANEIDAANDAASLLQAVEFYLLVGDDAKAIERLLTAIEGRNSDSELVLRNSLGRDLRSLGLQLLPQVQQSDQARLVLRAILESDVETRHVKPRQSTQVSVTSGVLGVSALVNGKRVPKQIYYPMFSSLFDQLEAMSFYAPVINGQDEKPRQELIDEFAVVSQEAKAAGNVDLQVYAGSLHAFVLWWADDFFGAYKSLRELADCLPDRCDLQIEAARLAGELNSPAKALELLDRTQPRDQETLRIRELTALTMAIQLGETERAKQAANRLCSMNLDTQTQLSLLKPLKALGLQSLLQSNVLRIQRPGSHTDQELYAIAETLCEFGEVAAAGELALQLIKRHAGSPKSASIDIYHVKAMQLLRQHRLLEDAVAEAQRRLQAAPNSITLQRELAVLTNPVISGLATTSRLRAGTNNPVVPQNPRRMIREAEALANAQKSDEALQLYVSAITLEPGLLKNCTGQILKLAKTPGQLDKVYQVALGSPVYLTQVRPLIELLESHQPDTPRSTTALKVLSKLLESGTLDDMPSLLRLIGDVDQQRMRPSVSATFRRLFASANVYQSSNTFVSVTTFTMEPADKNASRPFTAIMQVLNNDAALFTVVSQLVDDQIEVAGSQTVAGALRIGLDADRKDPQALDEDVDEYLAKQGKTLPVWLLRELSLNLAQRPEMIGASIKLLEAVDAVVNPHEEMEHFETSVGEQLVAAYIQAGRREQGIDRLMNAYFVQTETYDASNNKNSGLREAQLLQSLETISRKLIECNAPIEAAIVLQFALSQPTRFVMARRMAGEQLQQRLSELLDSVMKQISPDGSLDFVQRQSSRFQSRPKSASRFRIGTLMNGEGEPTSALRTACQSLPADEAGRAALGQLESHLAQVAVSGPLIDKLHYAAGRAMIALAIDSESASERISEFQALLPMQQHLSNESTPFDASELLAFVPLAIDGLGSGDESTAKAADQLAQALAKVATQQVDVKAFKSLMNARHRGQRP